MRYVMFVCVDPPDEEHGAGDALDEWARQLDHRKMRFLGNHLRASDRAITVRRRNGKILVTDGPFAETKE